MPADARLQGARVAARSGAHRRNRRRHRHRQRAGNGGEPAARIRGEEPRDHPHHGRRQQRRQPLAAAGGGDRQGSRDQGLHHPDRQGWPRPLSHRDRSVRPHHVRAGGDRRQSRAAPADRQPHRWLLLRGDRQGIAGERPQRRARQPGEEQDLRRGRKHPLRRVVRALLRAGGALRASRRRPARHAHAGGAMTGIQTTLLGQHIRVLTPLLLWIAPLGLIAGVLAAVRSWQRQQRVAALVPGPRLGHVIQGGGSSQGIAKGSLLGLGLFFLFVAAAGLQCGERTELVKRTGIDLVVALDASNSMLARDVKPSRIERAKLEVTALLDRLKGDRVGLVVFAGDAFVQCPLTTDYAAARLFLRAVDPTGMPQQGTAIANALLESKRVLEGGGRGSAANAVLLITDGEDQQGDALKYASDLGDSGIRVYAVPVGSEAGEPIPVVDKNGNVTGYKKDKAGRTVLTRTDVAGLRELASRGNGLVLRGTGAEMGVLQFGAELEKLQK